MIKMFASFLAFFLACSIMSVVGALTEGYPVCGAPEVTGTGLTNVFKSLDNCSNTIPGNLIPPSYFDASGEFKPTTVQVGLLLNNLIVIDDMTTTITFDFYFRLQWTDPRLNMYYLFDSLNPDATLDGLDITQYVRSSSFDFNIWLPDITFYQIISKEVVAELIKLYPNGTIYWARHILGSFEEPSMSFKVFPHDQQKFTLVLQSFALDSNLIELELFSTPVSLNEDARQVNKPYIKENPLWSYKGYDAVVQSDLIASPLNPNRHFSTAYISLYFERKFMGVVYRLALPITVLMMVVGISFWADEEKRLDVALRMILVVAAMYIVVTSIIPSVGMYGHHKCCVDVLFCFVNVDINIVILFMHLICHRVSHFHGCLHHRSIHSLVICSCCTFHYLVYGPKNA